MSALLIQILQVAPPVIGTTALLIIAIRGFRRVEAKVGSVYVTAEAVNRAVNNVPADSPTLRQLVDGMNNRLETHITRTDERFDLIEQHITNPTWRNNA